MCAHIVYFITYFYFFTLAIIFKWYYTAGFNFKTYFAPCLNFFISCCAKGERSFNIKKRISRTIRKPLLRITPRGAISVSTAKINKIYLAPLALTNYGVRGVYGWRFLTTRKNHSSLFLRNNSTTFNDYDLNFSSKLIPASLTNNKSTGGLIMKDLFCSIEYQLQQPALAPVPGVGLGEGGQIISLSDISSTTLNEVTGELISMINKLDSLVLASSADSSKTDTDFISKGSATNILLLKFLISRAKNLELLFNFVNPCPPILALAGQRTQPTPIKFNKDTPFSKGEIL